MTAGAPAPYNTGMRGIGLAAALVATVALGLATAAGAFAPPSLSRALELTKNVPCPGNSPHPVGPKSVRRFHAAAAVSCVDTFGTYPHSGQWEVLVRRVAVGSVAGLQRYFERPSRHHVPKGEICPDVLIATLVPVLVDARGNWLLPTTPRDGCGQPLAGGPPNVHWHVVSVRKVRLLVTAKALAADCPIKMGNTVAWAGPPHDAHAGTPLFDRTPQKVRVCVFRTPAGNFATGHFVRGFRLDAARTRRLLGALGGPGPRRGCPKQRNFAVVGGGPRLGAVVELGGCYRVERPDRTAGTANPSVIREMLGG